MNNKEENSEDFYFSIEDARKEIVRRRNDHELRKKIEAFLGSEMIDVFGDEPRAVFSQYVANVANDTIHFLNQENNIGLKPLFLEYSDDKFVAKNPGKYLLGRIYFSDNKKIENFANISKTTIINFNTEEGKKINEVKSIWGEGLVEFHHNIFFSLFPEMRNSVYDSSAWFQKTRFSTEYYYLYYLALFIYHGVLFENIELDGREENFSKNKILPSFYELERMFGVKPIICQLIPTEKQDDLYWWCYPERSKIVMTEYVKNNYSFDLKI